MEPLRGRDLLLYCSQAVARQSSPGRPRDLGSGLNIVLPFMIICKLEPIEQSLLLFCFCDSTVPTRRRGGEGSEKEHEGKDPSCVISDPSRFIHIPRSRQGVTSRSKSVPSEQDVGLFRACVYVCRAGRRGRQLLTRLALASVANRIRELVLAKGSKAL